MTKRSDDILTELRRHGRDVVDLCIYGKWLAEQDSDTREALHEAVLDDQISYVAITEYAQARGYMGSLSAVRVHGREQCVCRKVPVPA